MLILKKSFNFGIAGLVTAVRDAPSLSAMPSLMVPRNVDPSGKILEPGMDMAVV